MRTQANVMIEIPFTSPRSFNDPFNEVTLDVLFTDPTGKEFRVPAFWAGGNSWKVRYASPTAGTHRYRPEGADIKGTGSIEITPYTGTNPLYKHGPLKVSSNRRYLEHADGAPFF